MFDFITAIFFGTLIILFGIGLLWLFITDYIDTRKEMKAVKEK
jgi:hypothetical protein